MILMSASCISKAEGNDSNNSTNAGGSENAGGNQEEGHVNYPTVLNWKVTDGLDLEIFLPEKDFNCGTVVIACPGGAYYKFGGAYEGTYWSELFNNCGCAYAVLKYTFPQGNPALPMNDLKAAINIFLENAHDWMVDKDKIGVMGFSAGGHLASTAATHLEGELKPAFQILFYPVITMGDGTHSRSRTELLGSNPTQSQIELYSNQLQVDASTPKAFITYALDDTSVVPQYNGKAYYNALVAKNIPVKLCEYSKGGHGWGADFPSRTLVENELVSWVLNL